MPGLETVVLLGNLPQKGLAHIPELARPKIVCLKSEL